MTRDLRRAYDLGAKARADEKPRQPPTQYRGSRAEKWLSGWDTENGYQDNQMSLFET